MSAFDAASSSSHRWRESESSSDHTMWSRRKEKSLSLGGFRLPPPLPTFLLCSPPPFLTSSSFTLSLSLFPEHHRRRQERGDGRPGKGEASCERGKKSGGGGRVGVRRTFLFHRNQKQATTTTSRPCALDAEGGGGGGCWKRLLELAAVALASAVADAAVTNIWNGRQSVVAAVAARWVVVIERRSQPCET